MIITYIRSSSYGTHSMCEQQYFFEYVLGHRSPSNKKADKGTIVHKVLEVLAGIKLSEQNNQIEYIDDILGPINIKNYSLDTVAEKIYSYYTSQFKHHEWEVKDYKDCRSWVHKAITDNNGDFDPRSREIVQPEQHFDIVIDKPWAHYKYETKDGTIEGNLAIKGTMDLITKVNDNTLEMIDWKGLPVDTKLPTPNGWTTMGEISVGDTVFDQYGEQCSVVGKSQIKFKPCYKITFDDTSSAICDDEHLWKLHTGSTVGIQDLLIGDKINVAKPIDCGYVDLPIEPYLLGVWLGDGRNRSCEITSGDEEIFNFLVNDGHQVGKNLENRVNTVRSSSILKETKKLRKLQLLHNKHIPEKYFRASYEQRLMLLRGLMDTDGNANPSRKQVEFTSCNKQLANDVKHLALTLGQRPYIYKQKRKTIFTNNKYIDVYHVYFRPIDINPFRIDRKADKIDSNWGPGKSNVRTIKSIEIISKQYTQCISVDSTDNTYLCTENYIPTHNTGKRLDWATGQEKTLAKLYKDPQLMIYHYALSKLYTEYEHIIATINFINDGGAFSVCFDKKDLSETESIIRKKFETIKKCKKPILSKSWKCNRLCHFGKNTFENTNTLPILEYRDGQICSKGNYMTKCEQIKHEIELKGMKSVVDEYTSAGYSVGKYKAPGSIE